VSGGFHLPSFDAASEWLNSEPLGPAGTVENTLPIRNK
jgi:hypothetical protein